MQGTEIGKTTLNKMTEFSPPMLRFLSSYSSQEFVIPTEGWMHRSREQIQNSKSESNPIHKCVLN